MEIYTVVDLLCSPGEPCLGSQAGGAGAYRPLCTPDILSCSQPDSLPRIQRSLLHQPNRVHLPWNGQSCEVQSRGGPTPASPWGDGCVSTKAWLPWWVASPEHQFPTPPHPALLGPSAVSPLLLGPNHPSLSTLLVSGFQP